VWKQERGWYPDDHLAQGARLDPIRLQNKV
jgi:hypothetical protein